MWKESKNAPARQALTTTVRDLASEGDLRAELAASRPKECRLVAETQAVWSAATTKQKTREA